MNINHLNNHPIRFKLVAQNRGDKLVIEAIEQKVLIICRAHEIVCDPELICGFSPEDAARIGVTAGMEMAAL